MQVAESTKGNNIIIIIIIIIIFACFHITVFFQYILQFSRTFGTFTRILYKVGRGRRGGFSSLGTVSQGPGGGPVGGLLFSHPLLSSPLSLRSQTKAINRKQPLYYQLDSYEQPARRQMRPSESEDAAVKVRGSPAAAPVLRACPCPLTCTHAHTCTCVHTHTQHTQAHTCTKHVFPCTMHTHTHTHTHHKLLALFQLPEFKRDGDRQRSACSHHPASAAHPLHLPNTRHADTSTLYLPQFPSRVQVQDRIHFI